MNCVIITIGDELLIGQTIDTNSAWLAQELNKIGVVVTQRIAVGDNKNAITEALILASQKADLIILTGGLGPTSDDITKPLLCEFFETQLVEHEAVLEHVKQIFTKRNRPLLSSNLQQALVPATCEVLFNNVGTAPGMLFRKDKKLFISLPGVPFEMQYITSTHIIPLLKKEYSLPTIFHKTLITAGLGESFVAEKLQDFESQLPPTIKLAYLPKLGSVKLRLTGTNCLEEEISQKFEALQKQLSDILVSTLDEEIEATIAKILTQTNKTISTAESCTGGNIASLLTSIKGASDYFKGGIVTYATESKISTLNIPTHLIDTFGVVSSETVKAMAVNVRKQFNSDYALSISGYLEKNDHNNEIWIGLASNTSIESVMITGFYDRQKNTVLASNTALNLFRKFILKH